MTKKTKYLLPPAVILFAVFIAWVIIALKPSPEKKGDVAERLPIVEGLAVNPETVTLYVYSQGTIVPATETTLRAEVSGTVNYVAPNYVVGGFFKKGDLILSMDPTEAQLAVAKAEVALTKAKVQLEEEEARALQAKLDWKTIGRGEASDFVLRKPQIQNAQADLKSAQTGVAEAKQKLNATTVNAPYDGIIGKKIVELGQRVTAEVSELTQLYAIDSYEVRLPLSSREMAFLGISRGYRFEDDSHLNIPVTFFLKTGGNCSWSGEIVRTEGMVDIKSRLAYVVARIKDPFRRNADNVSDCPALSVGEFVQAKIKGVTLQAVYRVPRQALINNDAVRVVDSEGRLITKRIKIAQVDLDNVIITEGLAGGDIVCLTDVPFFVEGMRVNLRLVKQGSEDASLEIVRK
ncbi:MAG: hypothetical protein COZ46_05070 [Verrucomicrobia bacterium CG_4_10_14_3_um_filter_43_23]|nr:MAG: hypothetical protein AUJ82_05295 [Verrucomicrobia bacterium CG1_02_43_26]PIP58742.1 MAG: hypothetical protein COX01_06940 [Verrucomicrobia bacterium CG22_combo_CG10-13_8_21_14_all_43_17]PIX58212.1 MAG: hypothetical protein COZ46_05070 [Verrucomicrobia bacterium CG_4_10_14_3_um_filter_43_23]PIY61547.1 MAG: hypothetical protein COY94_05065 [Verrucomicrobia bacterium CG_4_10_14_0_8_um_filter_43_34]PJA44385.1 MAG: hypothetical protein CO175_02975 [Verrucomicrobia bacterium CG_4_9_14_3_um_fi